ncbi:MAG: dimethyl sulfoxide reductase anchor subunit [Burkholderiales bacterium]|nr:dimethyl sulfoxide reductase anchor subunit [Burkholderiales bacterium]
MKPALSVIFFTVSSGAGLGLLVWLLIASLMADHIRMDAATFHKGAVIAALLITAGLVSSTLHLANRKNSIYALTRWHTSWLSREGLLAIALYPVAGLHLYALNSGLPQVTPVTLWLLVALALAIMLCTGMIYGCLKTVPRWNTWMTPAKYVLFGLMSGAVLLPAVLSMRPAAVGPVGKPMMAVVLLAAGLVLYVAYLLQHPRKSYRINDALGFREGNVRLLDAGHSHGTFLTNEFGFVLARERARLLRWVAIMCGFVVPLLLCYFSQWFWAASIICLIGLFVERWLFFAEAEHVVRLYHGQPRV